jgi:hypothetical protein
MDAAATGGFTIAMWVNPGEAINNPGEYQLVYTPGDAIGFTIMNNTFDGDILHDRVLLFWDGDLPSLHVGTTTLEPGTWYHVAITSPGMGGPKKYYVNGIPEEQRLLIPSQGGVPGEHNATRDGWGAGDLTIGAHGSGSRAHGSIIDDVRIYERVLTTEDFLDLIPEPPVAEAPANLTATGQIGEIQLAWDDPSPANAVPVTGYNVYRSTTAGGPYEKITDAPVEAREFTDATVMDGTEYCYVVRAVGLNTLESSDSNEACATPAQPGGLQVPGDCNQDGTLDLSDAVCVFGVLFTGVPAQFPCGEGLPTDAANITLIDWQPDAAVDISDGVGILQFLFGGGPPHPLAVEGAETTGCVPIMGCPANEGCP